MKYTQLKVKAEYRDKLKALADSQHRSMANLLEVLIDQAVERTPEATTNGNGSGVHQPTDANPSSNYGDKAL